jgi:hypothetical protein
MKASRRAGKMQCSKLDCLIKESSRFLKKRRKNFCYAGPWAVSAPTPKAQINKVFLLLFVHKK